MATGTLDRDHLRYTPGDGYVYVWQAGDPWIHVRKIVRSGAGDRVEVETPDVIAVPDSRTGEQLAMAVDCWREVTR